MLNWSCVVYFKKVVLILVSIVLLGGCFEEKLPDKTVAMINGKAIELHTVQSLQEIEFMDFNDPTKPSVAKLRKQYGTTLSTIILYEIILQHIEEKGYIINDEQVKTYENGLLADYPPGEFEKYITENAIDIDAWRTLLRYQLALDVFKNVFLREAYVPSIEEIKEYYEEHRSRFFLEKSYTLQVGLSEDKDSLGDIDNLQTLLDKKNNIVQYSVTMNDSALPQELKKSIVDLAQGECTEIITHEDIFSRMCLTKENEKKNTSITEAYSYIEHELMSEYVDEMLYKWLENNTQSFEVQVSKHLIKELVADDN